MSTLALLEKQEITVLLCEQNLLPGTWRDVLEHLNAVPQAPPLIVTSKFADDRLGGEALNLGAWDVLAKPFDHIEVIRSVKIGMAALARPDSHACNGCEGDGISKLSWRIR